MTDGPMACRRGAMEVFSAGAWFAEEAVTTFSQETVANCPGSLPSTLRLTNLASMENSGSILTTASLPKLPPRLTRTFMLLESGLMVLTSRKPLPILPSDPRVCGLWRSIPKQSSA